MISPGVFRLLLATLVVLAHFTKLGLGTAAVNLFFILSGYWVYRMYSSKYERAKYPRLLFVASRVLRILPVFLLFNCMAFLLHLALQDETAYNQTLLDIIPNTLIIGYSSLPYRPLGPAWSLDMELQFYLLFPMLFFIFSSLVKSATTTLVCMLTLGGLYIALFIDSDVGAASVMPYTGFFMLGMFTAQHSWKPPAYLTTASVILVISGIVAIISVPSVRGPIIHNIDQNDFTWNAAVNVIVALVVAPIALSSVYTKSTSRDRVIGDLSYVVYCSHWLAVIVAGRYLADYDKFHKGIAIIGLVSLTYALSFLVLIYFDRPIGRWREAWVARSLGNKASVKADSMAYRQRAAVGTSAGHTVPK